MMNSYRHHIYVSALLMPGSILSLSTYLHP